MCGYVMVGVLMAAFVLGTIHAILSIPFWIWIIVAAIIVTIAVIERKTRPEFPIRRF